MSPNRPTQQEIIRALGVRPTIDVGGEIEARVAFLAERMTHTGANALVLGVSGGVDSTVAGGLCRRAVARAAGARLYAVRLPYAQQEDADDAATALDFIAADEVLTIDIEPATRGMREAFAQSALSFAGREQEDFIFGNVKARQRMIAQYAIASRYGALVVGTGQAAEAAMGFFTKFGDGACDLEPLAGLTKRQVRALGEHLGAPQRLTTKVPTADLESLHPQRPDEQALGVTYEAIDDFLEGRAVSDAARATIVDAFYASTHKRALPATPGA
jgi:NAD+ synthase